MGYTLKLDIYYFSLKKITKVIERKTRGGVLKTGYITEDDDIQLEEFFNVLYGTLDAKEAFVLFLSEFINIFGNEFKNNEENTQAISISDKEMKDFNSGDNTIWGQFKGGQTGIDKDIYKNKNSKNIESTLNKEDVASLPYFYKMWFPFDSNVGVLILQSYTVTGCSSLFRLFLDNFFISKGYKVNWAKCVPEEYIKKYIENSYIYSIKVLTKKRKSSEPFLPIFESFQQANQSTFIKNIHVLVSKLLTINNYTQVLKSQIAAIDVNFDTNEDDLLLFYKDNDGKRAHAKLSNIDDVLPNFILDDTLKDPITQRPIWDELHKFTDNLLEKIQIEISYTPKSK